MRSHWKVGWVARFTRGYWRACSAIGLSHETASLIVATVPELPSVLLAAQELQASRLQQLRRRVRVLSRYGKRGPGLVYHLPTWSSAIDKQTASGSDLSECSPLESPGYLTPANPGRQGTISTASDRFSHGNGRSDDSGEHQRRQCVQTGRQIRLIVRMI